MEYERPIVLSIAGMDPCGGAGLLADIKTIEQHQCLGFGVTTAITCQTENRFESIKWLSAQEIISQIKPLLREYHVAAVKIGLIENSQVFHEILEILSVYKIRKIVWDPVLSASSGFDFNNYRDIADLPGMIRQIALMTPNMHEVTCLAGDPDPLSAATTLSYYTDILLKGGHHLTEQGTDYLFTECRKKVLAPTLRGNHAKHGSGCVLSSSIASFLAKDETIEQSCIQAKLYIEKILVSTPHLLAFHHV